MAYNMTNVTNAVNIAEQFIEVNRSTEGTLAVLSLVTLWFVLFMLVNGRQANDPAEAMAAASVTVTFFGFALAVMGAMEMMYAWGFTIVFAISLIVLIVKR